MKLKPSFMLLPRPFLPFLSPRSMREAAVRQREKVHAQDAWPAPVES